jgi:hypothetical protein
LGSQLQRHQPGRSFDPGLAWVSQTHLGESAAHIYHEWRWCTAESRRVGGGSMQQSEVSALGSGTRGPPGCWDVPWVPSEKSIGSTWDSTGPAAVRMCSKVLTQAHTNAQTQTTHGTATPTFTHPCTQTRQTHPHALTSTLTRIDTHTHPSVPQVLLQRRLHAPLPRRKRHGGGAVCKDGVCGVRQGPHHCQHGVRRCLPKAELRRLGEASAGRGHLSPSKASES